MIDDDLRPIWERMAADRVAAEERKQQRVTDFWVRMGISAHAESLRDAWRAVCAYEEDKRGRARSVDDEWFDE